ncbi:Zeta-class glutathione S-transferase, partial [Trichostrongylus colubriformis]
MTGAKPVLYSYWRSSCSWRVRIALNLKKIDYEYKAINLLSTEYMEDPEFTAINACRKVPALVIDGVNLTESLAIMEYLDEKYPDRYPLLPKDPVKRAQARAIALQIACGIQPLQNVAVVKYLNAETAAGHGPKFAAHWIIRGLGDLEEMVSRTSGKYAVGDQVTIADICIPSILYNAKR